MSYSTTTSITNQSDLMSQLSTFAVTTMGWTQDNYDGTLKKMSLHKGTVYVHFWWDDTSTQSATYGTSIGMYQSLGFISAGTAVYAHTDDSQNGANSAATLCNERGIKFIGDGPYTSLHLFGQSSPTDTIYGVLEFAPGLYRHFAFGTLEKSGTWTGGEFCAGHHWDPENNGADLDNPTGIYHNLLMDAENYGHAAHPTSTRTHGTLHMENITGMITSGNLKWGIAGRCINMQTAYTLGRDGNARTVLLGGCRGGFACNLYGWQQPDLTKGFVPIIPCDIWMYEPTATAAEHYYYLGKMPNMGHVQMRGIDPQQAITVGAETWSAFPGVRKSKVGGNNQESWNMGLIYKQ